MRFLYRVTPVITMLWVLSAAATSYAQTTVETFTATATYNIIIPGNIVGPDIDFTGGMTITSLDFTPGSVNFEGQPVDFDGTEASWLANTYEGSASVPNLPGTAVNPSGSGTTAGPAGAMSGNQGKNGVNLGPTFSDSNFDLVVPSTFDGIDQIPSWNSPIIPELNGTQVIIITRSDVVNIIPNFVIGSFAPPGAVVDVVITGQIDALPSTVATEPSTWSQIKALYR